MRDLGTHTAHLSTIVVAASVVDDCDVVHLAGHFDMNTASKVRETVLSDDGLTRPRLLLELDGLELLDSSGIGAIVQLNRGLGERGTRLGLVTTSTHLRKLFRISALDSVIPLHESVGEAQGHDPDDFGPLSAG